MSPEQTNGSRLDSRSDIFSFGTVLYEMLSGARPFGGGSLVSIMAAIQDRDPKPIDGLPQELDRLLMRCLRKEPDRRWQSMDDLKIALEELSHNVHRVWCDRRWIARSRRNEEGLSENNRS
jgi:serine/threonine protein kinase